MVFQRSSHLTSCACKSAATSAVVDFALVNISGGVGGIYYFFKIISLPPDNRIEWANQCDAKISKSVIWKKELS